MQRRKVASLLIAAHRDLRAAIEFFRRDEQDADQFVPSIYFTGTRDGSRDAPTPAPKPPAGPVSPRSLTNSAIANEPSDSPFIDEK